MYTRNRVPIYMFGVKKKTERERERERERKKKEFNLLRVARDMFDRHNCINKNISIKVWHLSWQLEMLKDILINRKEQKKN